MGEYIREELVVEPEDFKALERLFVKHPCPNFAVVIYLFLVKVVPHLEDLFEDEPKVLQFHYNLIKDLEEFFNNNGVFFRDQMT